MSRSGDQRLCCNPVKFSCYPLPSFPKRMRIAATCALILAVVIVLYYPVFSYPFINYDDADYVTENVHIRNGLTFSSIKWAFASSQDSNWHPVTWISHALDVQFFGLQPGGHHATNVILHALNSVLLFLLAFSATRRYGPSLVVAMLFAIHPINVESVAWVAERKNVLSTLFFFLTLGAYGWYSRKPHWTRYLLLVALFACGLMAKPMLVTLPFVLLLLDFWPLGRFSQKTNHARLVLEKLPLFTLSVISSVITYQVQAAGHAMGSTARLPFVARLENAILAYGLYLWKTIWPVNLAPFYPHPGTSVSLAGVILSALALAAITGLCLAFRARRYLLTGWCWFLGTLVPVIGLVQVGNQAMADRYAYVPLIGIFLMVVWTVADFLHSRKASRTVSVAVSVLPLLALAYATNRQIDFWSSDVTLWSHTLAVTANNAFTEGKLGWALMVSNQPEEALLHLREAAALDPSDPTNYINLGICLGANHDPALALDQFKTAITLSTDKEQLASAYLDSGVIYDGLSDYAAARDSYTRALQYNPTLAVAYMNRGLTFEKEGNVADAVTDYEHSIQIQPTAKTYLLLSRAQERLNRPSEAQASYEKAMQLQASQATP